MMLEKHKTFLYAFLLTIIFWGVAWWFWTNLYSGHLHFHEQFQLFQFTTDYLKDTLALPGGLAHYLSRFLVQFFYEPKLGALVMALLLIFVQLAAFMLLCCLPARRAVRTFYSFSFVPAIITWHFLLQADAMPVVAVSLILAMTAAACGFLIRQSRIRWIYEIVMSVFLFVTIGAAFTTFLWLMTSFEVAKQVERKEWAGMLLVVLLASMLQMGIPAVGTLFYSYPFAQLIAGVGYYRYPLMDEASKYLALYSAVWVGCCFMFRQTLPSWKKGIFWSMLIFVGGYGLLASGTNKEEESVLDYNRLTRWGAWDAILAKAAEENPQFIWEQCCVNLALAQKGALCERLFAYPVQKREALIPVYAMDYMTPMYAGEPYFYLGLVNTALRFSFESMEATPDYQKSGRCYQRLAQTNLLNGNKKVAKLYLDFLKQAPYYKDWAIRMETLLEDDCLLAKDSLLGPIRAASLKEDFFYSDNLVMYALEALILHYPQNDLAWQYLFAYCMIEKRLDLLAHYASLSMKLIPDTFIPLLVQEALLVFWAQQGQQLEDIPWPIDNNVQQRFMQFLQAANQSPKLAKDATRKSFGDSFWYYYLYGGDVS